MKVTQALHLALRLTVPQNVSANSTVADKLVFPAAFVLAGLGVGLSSFSLKRLIEAPKH